MEVIVIMEMEEAVEVYATVGVVRRSIRWLRLLCSWMIVNCQLDDQMINFDNPSLGQVQVVEHRWSETI